MPHFLAHPSPSNKAGWTFTVNCSGILLMSNCCFEFEGETEEMETSESAPAEDKTDSAEKETIEDETADETAEKAEEKAGEGEEKTGEGEEKTGEEKEGEEQEGDKDAAPKQDDAPDVSGQFSVEMRRESTYNESLQSNQTIFHSFCFLLL